MRQGWDRLRENKLAAVGCLLLVASLTVLGIWTNSTAERQGAIEKIVRVQHTQVVQALCNRPFTSACLGRAINIVKTCLADENCARLLTMRPDFSRSQAGSGFRVENPKTYKSDNSSSGKRRSGAKSGGPGSPESGSGGGKQGAGDSQPQPGPGTDESSGSPAPAGPESDGGDPSPATGPVPEAVEGVVGCLGKVDLACTLGEVGRLAPPGR